MNFVNWFLWWAFFGEDRRCADHERGANGDSPVRTTGLAGLESFVRLKVVGLNVPPLPLAPVAPVKPEKR